MKKRVIDIIKDSRLTLRTSGFRQNHKRYDRHPKNLNCEIQKIEINTTLKLT